MSDPRASKDPKVLKREELARANELLSQIQTEIRVFEDRRNAIRADIQAETEELKRRRVEEVEEAIRVTGAGLPALKAERQSLNSDISKLTRDKQALESDVAGLQVEITAHRDHIGQLNREYDTVRRDKEAAEAHVAAANARVATIQATIAPLREEFGQLKDEVRMLSERRTEVEAEILAYQRKHQLTKADLELAITGLERKRRDLATDLTADAANIKRAQEELTIRTETLAKQEKLVRAREYKLALAEEKIAQNIGLLNL